MTMLVVGTNEFPVGVTLVPAGKMTIVNHDSHNMKQKGLFLITIKGEEIMWIHPDLLKNEQWSSFITQGNMRTSNTISANLEEDIQSPMH